MPHVAELSYPGRWLDHEDHEWSLRVESRFHHLERFLAEAAISLDLFEDAMRQRERGAHARGPWTPAFAGETVPSFRRKPESRREVRLPESYEHLVPYVHARAFMGAMDDVGRWLAALEHEEQCPPRAGMLVLEEREGRWHALRPTGGCPREMEVSGDTLLAARDRVQAAIAALPWRGPCRNAP